jgi:hypothetical protein
MEVFFDGKFFSFLGCSKLLIIVLGIAMAVYASIRSTEVQGLTSME